MLSNTSARSPRNGNILLIGFHKLLHFVLLYLKRLARWVVMPFLWWWHTMKTDLKIGIAVTIIVVPLLAIGSAMLLHWLMPKPEIIVSPFELPAGTDGIPWTGRTVANFFIDEMDQIMSNASEFHGQQFASRHQYKKVPDLPKIPIEKNFDLQIEGLSLKQVMSTWDSLRYDQQHFSGDVILNPDNTLTLRVRVASDKQARYWEISELKPKGKIQTLDGLKQGLRELAVQVFTSLNPETVDDISSQKQWRHNNKSNAVIPEKLRYRSSNSGYKGNRPVLSLSSICPMHTSRFTNLMNQNVRPERRSTTTARTIWQRARSPMCSIKKPGT